MLEQIYEEVQSSMDKTIQAYEKELGRIRTGRASLTILDGIRVNYYGTPTPLNQLASLSIPESRLITIQPWDKSAIGDIEKAIQKSDLGLTPSNDGQIIRIAIPPLTEERRKELTKVVRKRGEDCRVVVRNARRDGNEKLKKMEKKSDISEDDLHRALSDIQDITNELIEKIDKITTKKEKEIMEV